MNQNDKEIVLTDVLYRLWANKIAILALAFIFAVCMFLQSAFFTAPLYKADGILYISNKNAFLSGDRIEQSDIVTSRALGDIYIEVLRSRSFLSDVSEATGGYYDWKAIRSMLSVSSINETELISVSVVCGNPDDARNIGATILAKAPDKLKNILNGGYVVTVDPISDEVAQIGKGTTKKTMLGFIFGAFLAIVIIFLRDYFDKTVHRGEDVAKRYNISILGNVSQ